jgi:hypothetical protein
MINRAATIALLALPAFALGACNKGAANNAASTTNSTTTTSNSGATTTTSTTTASAGGAGVRMEPGEWEMSIEAEGMGAAHTSKTCITPEMADRAAADMANGGAAQANGMNCDRSGLTMAGGRMNGTVTCTGPNNMRMSSTVNGEITPTTMDVRQQTSMQMAGQDRTVNSHISGHRTGECTASTPGAAGAGAGATTSGNAMGGEDKE